MFKNQKESLVWLFYFSFNQTDRLKTPRGRIEVMEKLPKEVANRAIPTASKLCEFGNMPEEHTKA